MPVARVRASLARQRALHTIGARLVRVEPGGEERRLAGFAPSPIWNSFYAIRDASVAQLTRDT